MSFFLNKSPRKREKVGFHINMGKWKRGWVNGKKKIFIWEQ